MKSSIWKWFETEYKVHCSNRKLYDRILTWKRSRPGGVYHIPGKPNEYDAIIPEEYVDKVNSILNSDLFNKVGVSNTRSIARSSIEQQ